MFFLMLLWVVGYVWAAFYIVTHFVRKVESRCEEKIQESRQVFDHFSVEKEKIGRDKTAFERQASEIFTLYEMTREITKKSDEQGALEVFQNELKANVSRADCQLVSAFSHEYKEILSDKKHFLFSLKAKKDEEKYLAFKGLKDDEKEKAMILSHQFALALRRIELYKEVEELAMTDSLTGTHTRRHFLARFE